MSTCSYAPILPLNAIGTTSSGGSTTYTRAL